MVVEKPWEGNGCVGLENRALPCPELPTEAGRPRVSLNLPELGFLKSGAGLFHYALTVFGLCLLEDSCGVTAPWTGSPLRAGAIPDSFLYLLLI